jgi:hypothetical protein
VKRNQYTVKKKLKRKEKKNKRDQNTVIRVNKVIQVKRDQNTVIQVENKEANIK